MAPSIFTALISADTFLLENALWLMVNQYVGFLKVWAECPS